MARNRQRSGVPRYHRFNPYNFASSDFLSAARRFLELREAMVAAEERSEAEPGHEDFARCDLCDGAGELRSQYQFFASRFAFHWALKLIESAPSENKPPASAMIECSVCRRDIPKKEYYGTHINLHPCE